MRALITGISGFVGGHLNGHLLGLGWQVFGFDKRAPGDEPNVLTGDMKDHDALRSAFQASRPDVVFHLAGLIKSDQPEAVYQANVIGTVNLFECVMELEQRPVVLMASSSAVYGPGFGGRPITENFKPRPMTHYAVSKLAQEMVALRYFAASGIPVMIVRMFNLLGPGQPPDLACSAFALQIALTETLGGNEIVTGDLGARRDFVDVRDAVRAFALAAEKGKPGQIYNVCSGHAVLMRKCLDEMLSMSTRQFRIRMDAGKIQKNDVPVQVGNAGKLNKATGWHPQIRRKQSIFDLLNYWRLKVKSELELQNGLEK